MAQEKVMKDSEGKYFIQKMVTPPVDTGVVLEEGLNLTPSELREVMNGGKAATQYTTSQVWGRYYLYRILTSHVTEVIQKEGNTIQRVEVDKKEVKEKFNPLLPLASLYVISMLLSNLFVRRGSSVAAAVAIAAISVAVAIPSRTSTEVKIGNWATMIGIMAMLLLLAIGLVN
jgi:hypothetical protein